MKTIIIAVGIVIAMGVAVNIPFTAEVIQGEQTIIEVEKEKEVIMLDQRVKTAQEAEMSQIEASAQEAYDNFVSKELKQIEDKVKVEYIKELEATISDPDY